MALPFDPKQDGEFERLARELAPGMKRKPIAKKVRKALDPFDEGKRYLFEEEHTEVEYDDEIFLRDFIGSLAAPGPSYDLLINDLGAGVVDINALISGGALNGTFTRATTAMTMLSTGLLASVASGVPRSYYDPSSFVTNLCLRSQELEVNGAGAPWNFSRGDVIANQAIAPDGTLTADKVIDTTASGSHRVYQTVSKPAAARQYTWSIWLKAAEWTEVRLRMAGNGEAEYAQATFDLSDGTISSAAVADGALVDPFTSPSAAIEADSNGWYRCSLTATTDTTASVTMLININGGVSYVGTGTDGHYAWGSQLEFGGTTGEYVPTTTSSAIGGGTYLGYLAEGARTNLCLQSEAFSDASWAKTRSTVSANAAVAPDGATTADKLVEDATAAASHLATVTQATITADATQTVSVWLKAGERTWAIVSCADATLTNQFFAYFNLATGEVGTTDDGGAGAFASASSVAYPNGWYRCTIVGAVNGGVTSAGARVYLASADNGATYDGDGASGLYVWGAQHEQAAFASSYIPTTTASVTRNADVLTYPTNWFSDAQGTMLIFMRGHYDGLSVMDATRIALGRGDANGRFHYSSGGGALTVHASYDGTSVDSVAGPAATSGNDLKICTAWSGVTKSMAANGGISTGSAYDGTWSSGILRVSVAGGGNDWFGPIRRVTYWPYRLSDAQLQSITA